MVLNKPLEAIEENDLQALVDNQVAERKTIEYKESLPGNADGDKKEFLADVSSFANASGGDRDPRCAELGRASHGDV